MDQPRAAPRLSRVTSNVHVPQITVGNGEKPKRPVRRRKKEAAPLPPSFIQTTNSLLAPKNSTLTSSTISLPALRSDESPIRPESSLSTYSRYKKRRAPPPPVQIVKEVVEDKQELVLDIVTENEISSSKEEEQIDTKESNHFAEEESPDMIINDTDCQKTDLDSLYIKVDSSVDILSQSSDGLNPVENSAILNNFENTNREHFDDGNGLNENHTLSELVTESITSGDSVNINLTEESIIENHLKDSNHVNLQTQQMFELVESSKSDDEESFCQQPILDSHHTEQEDNQNLAITNSISMDEISESEETIEFVQKRNKSKKQKVKLGDKEGEDIYTKEKHNLKDVANNENSSIETNENEIDATTTTFPELISNESSSEIEKATGIDVNFKINTSKEKNKVKAQEQNHNDDHHEVLEQSIPLFRGAKVADIHKQGQDISRNSSQVIVDADEDDSDNDSLVNSDDELMDLFSKPTRNSTSPAGQDQESDLIQIKEKTKITGKEIEEKRKEEIRKSVGAKAHKWNLNEENPQEIDSETLRLQLKNLTTTSEGDPSSRAPLREIELDINSDDDLLPSLRSSRASSIVDMSSEDESASLAQQFAVKQLEKEVEEERKVTMAKTEISGALDESFAALSVEGSSFSMVKDTVVLEDEGDNSGSSRTNSPVIFDAVNPELCDQEGSYQHNDLPNVFNSEKSYNQVKSPSPDSGIHEFTDNNCTSPVIMTGVTDFFSNKIPEETAQAVTPDSGLDIRSGSVASSESGGSEDIGPSSKQNNTEQVELPKRHNLDKVLFSMSSYQERKNPDLLYRSDSLQEVNNVPSKITESFSKQLNSSLAARHSMLDVQDRSSQPPIFRSKIIEEFQVKTGIVVVRKPAVATSLSGSQVVHTQTTKETHVRSVVEGHCSRTNTQGDIVINEKGNNVTSDVSRLTRSLERNGLINSCKNTECYPSMDRSVRMNDEELYDCPRSLISGGPGTRQVARGTKNERVKKGPSPPNISMGVWGDQPRFVPVMVKEDGDIRQSRGQQLGLRNRGGETTVERFTLKKPLKPCTGLEIHNQNGQVLVGDLESKHTLKVTRSKSPHVRSKSPKDRSKTSKEMKNSQTDRSKSPTKRTKASRTKSKSPVNHKTTVVQKSSTVKAKLTHVRSKSPKVNSVQSNNNIQYFDNGVVMSSNGGQVAPRSGVNTLIPSLSKQTSASGHRTYLKQEVITGDENAVINSSTIQPPPYYFGMAQPMEGQTQGIVKTRPTAVGKVRENHTLSQPFRQHAQHKVQKEKEKVIVVKTNSDPVKFGDQHNKGYINLIKKTENINVTNNNTEKKHIVVKTNSNPPDARDKNNIGYTNLIKKTNNIHVITNNAEKRDRVIMPPPELSQEELNKAFQEELNKAKQRLKGSESAKINDSPDTPPPPPQPVLPKPQIITKSPNRAKMQPTKTQFTNPRDELMSAILNAAGGATLRKVSK